MGIKQAIASSAPMENIIAMLKTFNLSDYFDLLVSGAEIPAKPEPDVFLRTAEGLGFLGKKCLVIEDSTAGVKAAKRAGMVCIAVVTSHLESQLRSADLIIDDFSLPLIEAIRKINDSV
jgi:beta-phosphoglucomutase-like phosphatase (HAD superfamily)